uniref:COMM domain-containing protein n=1 Tax=Timema tahoe TaxID=61484 RepID=A0A7R9IB30_9NEOP|nr:unnamed protein product [Timema tahoe]
MADSSLNDNSDTNSSVDETEYENGPHNQLVLEQSDEEIREREQHNVESITEGERKEEVDKDTRGNLIDIESVIVDEKGREIVKEQTIVESVGDFNQFMKVILQQMNAEVGDVKASVAAVEFILTSSSRHGVEEDVLSSELQQLGLPREHSTSLVRVYSDNLTAFTSKLKSESLRFSRMEDVRWRVDFVSRSSRHYIDPDIPEPEVTISLRVWDSLAGLHKMHKFTTTGDMVALLLEGCAKTGLRCLNICLHCRGVSYDNAGSPEMEDEEDVDDR